MLKPVLPRLAFIEDYTLKSLRLKNEKWNKLIISDDQRGFLHSFVDQGRRDYDFWRVMCIWTQICKVDFTFCESLLSLFVYPSVLFVS